MLQEKEKPIFARHVISLPETSKRYRIDAGSAWISDKKNTFHIKKPVVMHLYPGDLVLRHPQVFQGGPEGWFDLAGWDEITITPEMVGQKIAIFVGDEIKSENDTLKPLQKKLGELLRAMGGRWNIIR